MAKKPVTVQLDDAIAALRALVDNPQLSPAVPADGLVHRRVEPVPVYWTRCPDCQTGHGWPSFGEDLGRQRAAEWMENHRRAYCPKKRKVKAA